MALTQARLTRPVGQSTLTSCLHWTRRVGSSTVSFDHGLVLKDRGRTTRDSMVQPNRAVSRGCAGAALIHHP